MDDGHAWMNIQVDRLTRAGWTVRRPEVWRVEAERGEDHLWFSLYQTGERGGGLKEGALMWTRDRAECTRMVDEACRALREASLWERDAGLITYRRPPQQHQELVITWGIAHEEE